MSKKRFVAVGTGGRIMLFIDAIAGEYKEHCELLALCDVSQTRMDYHRDRLQATYHCEGIQTFLAADFDSMIDVLKPDVVIVCTTDAFHHEYIVRAVNKGCDVICEKPIAVDEEQCQQILGAPGISSQEVRITFNVRWSPLATKVKEMIDAGMIGRVKHIQYECMLDLDHGGGYFRRWHSSKANSGGLLVHKSTHHFDLVNWWVNSIPKQVFAFGDLTYYGRENALSRGQEEWTKYDRYTGKAAPGDPFAIDLTSNAAGLGLYMAAEAETGYIYDRNVFRTGIDIEDTLSLVAKYRNGVTLNYSLNAFSPWAGYRVNITGDGGRLEYQQVIRKAQMIGAMAADTDKPGELPPPQQITYLPLLKKGEIIEIEKAEGNHSGADPRIQEQMFSPQPLVDPYGRSAGHEQGIASAILGIAANRSIATGSPVDIDDLVCLRPGTTRLSDLK